jgi:hypothetical protein
MLQTPSNDRVLNALNDAKYLYDNNSRLNRQQRFDKVMSLAEWDVFSIAQLSQISGYSTATLYGMGITKRGFGAGRFNPLSLDTLIQMRLSVLNKRPLSMVLLRAAIDEGNSHRVVSRFIGLNASTISRKLNG